MSHFEFDSDQDVVTEKQRKVTAPKRYRVLLLNDDYTSMEFVIFVLETVFHKSLSEATNLMYAVHQTGKGVCGVFTKEIAETKVALTLELARQYEYPLQCVMEED